MPWLIIGGIALFILGNKAYKAYTVATESTFNFAGIKDFVWIGNFPSGSLEFKILAQTNNPSKSSLKLDNLDLKLFDNNKLFSEIKAFGTGYEIKPGQNEVVEIPVSISGAYVFENYITPSIASLIKQGLNVNALNSLSSLLPKQLDVKGTVRVEGLNLPVNQQIKVLS